MRGALLAALAPPARPGALAPLLAARTRLAFLPLLALLSPVGPVAADEHADARPDAIVDLETPEGLRLVGGIWRFSDVAVEPVAHREPGPDLKASGAPNRTLDVAPHAGAAGFDDRAWSVVDPATLQARRGHGRLAFAWYRLAVTIPRRVGGLDPTGATVVFGITVDDYAEVWVDGRLPQVLGQRGGGLVAGWNAPNRVVLTRDARPGQRIQLAVFAANGPLSEPPANFVWIRSATLDFYAAGRFRAAERVPLRVQRLDPALDGLVPPDAVLERVASGFEFVEGPVWVEPGVLLFSDPNRNVIHRWDPDSGVSVFRTHSGYKGLDVGRYTQPGSNGLALDPQGRLAIAEHGNRRVTRLEPNGVLTVLADRFEGRRLNSPNDLVFRSDGTLYFSDPPFGLPRHHDDPGKELADTPVFCLHEGRLHAVVRDLRGPNGVALSPDERVLYVANWDPERRVVMRYDVGPGCTLGSGRVLFDVDAQAEPGNEARSQPEHSEGDERARGSRSQPERSEGDERARGSRSEPIAFDGVEVDARGHLYVSGPGGVWVLSPEGRPLGTLAGPEQPANFAWGDPDRRTLYMTARSGLYRIRLVVGGAR
jgi:gluconolactonase